MTRATWTLSLRNSGESQPCQHMSSANLGRYDGGQWLLTQYFFLPSVFMMKAKAEAEAKEMQAKGLKRGEDFVDCESPRVFVYARAHCPLHVPFSGSLGDFKVSALSCVHTVYAELPAPPRPPG